MGAYYYASGKKIELDDDADHVAVDQQAAARAGIDIPASAVHAAGGVIVAPRSAFDEPALDRLRQAGALLPVYKRDRAIVVALPEVRIEVDNAQQRAKVMKILDEASADHTIDDAGDDRIVVRPASGNGEDALQIANRVYERAKPASASVRFVQVVPKPDLVR